jgi:hypothetical protein
MVAVATGSKLPWTARKPPSQAMSSQRLRSAHRSLVRGRVKHHDQSIGSHGRSVLLGCHGDQSRRSRNPGDYWR